LLHYLFKD